MNSDQFFVRSIVLRRWGGTQNWRHSELETLRIGGTQN